MQKLLIMETSDSDVRSGAYGWDIEGGFQAATDIQRHIKPTRKYNDVPVGLVGHPSEFCAFATPLHAMGAGWRLMAPPTQYETDERDYYVWWFEKTEAQV